MIALLLAACGRSVDTDAATCISVMSAHEGIVLVDGEPLALVFPYQPIDVCVSGGEIVEFAEWPTVPTDPVGSL